MRCSQLLTLVTLLLSCSHAAASEAPPAQQLVDRGIEFLRHSQADDGSWSSHAGPGITALVTTSLLQSGVGADDSAAASGIEYILSHVQKDGGVYATGSHYRNYETSLAVMCLAEANADGKYDLVIQAADAFLKGLQWDEEEGHDIDSTSFGGAGYGKHSRPDLSNTSHLIDALIAAGNGPDDPAVQKALRFVSRSQNLESEHNTTLFSAKIGDGGFYYTPAAGGSSQADTTANGGLRSYGSMTYAGLKSMIYAGVEANDPRVQAAHKWIQKNFTLTENPGIGQSGVFYYYHTFAKALYAMGDSTVVDVEGVEHDWRAELVAKLAELQQVDGSWLNANDRWFEADPNLVTGYALLSLSYCQNNE
ncbi:MAG: prenyltransferase/squalene oxidase repeat-containing protein [Aeoliella sp.]